MKVSPAAMIIYCRGDLRSPMLRITVNSELCEQHMIEQAIKTCKHFSKELTYSSIIVQKNMIQ